MTTTVATLLHTAALTLARTLSFLLSIQTVVGSAITSGDTTGFQTFDVGVHARVINVVPKFQQFDQWFSINEVRACRYPDNRQALPVVSCRAAHKCWRKLKTEGSGLSSTYQPKDCWVCPVFYVKMRSCGCRLRATVLPAG